MKSAASVTLLANAVVALVTWQILGTDDGATLSGFESWLRLVVLLAGVQLVVAALLCSSREWRRAGLGVVFGLIVYAAGVCASVLVLLVSTQS